MALDLDANEFLSLVGAAAMFVMAIIVLRARPDRAQNRWFVALLAVEFVLATAGPTLAFAVDADVIYAAGFIFTFALTFLVPTYLGFLSTLDGRVSRALRTPVGRILPWTMTVFGTTLLLLRPSALIRHPDPTAKDIWVTLQGPLFPVYQAAFLATMILGLFVVVRYWRTRPKGTPARQKGAVFALAFGLNDGLMFLAIGASVVGGLFGIGENPIVWTLAYYGVPIAKLLLLGLVAYGILRSQLFDLDVRLKWTLSRGTTLAILAIAFSIVKETLEYLMPGEGLAASLAGAVAIGVLARPAWVASRRLAERAFPEADLTESSLEARRLEVFRASLESVAADGTVTPRERRMLETLSKQLSIPADAATAIEREVFAAARPTSRPTPEAQAEEARKRPAT